MKPEELVKLNSIVKWKDPELDGDNLLKRVIEDNGDRVILLEIDKRFSNWIIKPQFSARKVNLVVVNE